MYSRVPHIDIIYRIIISQNIKVIRLSKLPGEYLLAVSLYSVLLVKYSPHGQCSPPTVPPDQSQWSGGCSRPGHWRTWCWMASGRGVELLGCVWSEHLEQSKNQNQLESSLARRSLTGIPNQVVERKGKIIRKFSFGLTLFEVSISDRLKILNIYKLISPIGEKN